MKIILKLIGILGIVLFGFLFALTFLSAETLRESTKGFVSAQIEKEIKDKYSSSTASSIVDKAKGLSERLGVEEAEIRNKLATGLPEKIAAVLSAMCGYDCEKKKSLTKSITAGYLDKLKTISSGEKSLQQIIKGKYLEIAGNLRLDLRIFLGTNVLMFFVMFLISMVKSRATPQLFVAAILLLVSTITAASIYLFGQDWFYTIIYNDYMGYGYIVYLGVIFAVLMDIAFNKAKVTTEIINGFFSAIGSALSAVPC